MATFRGAGEALCFLQPKYTAIDSTSQWRMRLFSTAMIGAINVRVRRLTWPPCKP